MPPELDETTPMQPERAQRANCGSQWSGGCSARRANAALRAIVLRAGDFYGGAGRGSWFDLVIARDVSLDVVRYPGPLDVVHSWAYLPDLAQALVGLAEARTFGPLLRHSAFPAMR